MEVGVSQLNVAQGWHFKFEFVIRVARYRKATFGKIFGGVLLKHAKFLE